MTAEEVKHQARLAADEYVLVRIFAAISRPGAEFDELKRNWASGLDLMAFPIPDPAQSDLFSAELRDHVLHLLRMVEDVHSQ